MTVIVLRVAFCGVNVTPQGAQNHGDELFLMFKGNIYSKHIAVPTFYTMPMLDLSTKTWETHWGSLPSIIYLSCFYM